MKLSKINQNIVLKKKASCLVERERRARKKVMVLTGMFGSGGWQAAQWQGRGLQRKSEKPRVSAQVYLDFEQYPKEKD